MRVTVKYGATSRIWFVASLLVLALLPMARAEAQGLRVMTFNVRLPVAQDGPNDWPYRRDLLAATIREARADVVGTQELKRIQADYLAAQLPDYAWFGRDRRGDGSDEYMGIFYRRDRLRIVEQGDFWLSDTPDVPGSISWGHPYPRMVTWGLFETVDDGRRFYLLNTHFPYRLEDVAARMRGAAAIADHIAGLPARTPLILTGDFNTTPDSSVHAFLSQTMTDARSAPDASGPEATFHGFTGKADRRIDWIFARGFRPVRTQTDDSNEGGRYPSDHFPVIADLAWQQASSR